METKIYQERLKIGLKSQPEFLNDQDMLNSFVINNSLNHSYSLSNRNNFQLGELCTNYKIGAHGNNAKLNNKYIYRLAPISWLTNGKFEWDDSIISIVNAFEELLDRTQHGDWYPLNNVIAGIINNKRGFTWWTDYDPLSVKNHMKAIHKMGIANNWINEKSVIMRCELNKLFDKIKIPTIIDGYDSILFFPSKITPRLKSGFTLNLRNRKDFSDGCKEIVLRDVPTSIIEIKPLKLKIMKEKLIFYNTSVFLNDLYNFLITK